MYWFSWVQSYIRPGYLSFKPHFIPDSHRMESHDMLEVRKRKSSIVSIFIFNFSLSNKYTLCAKTLWIFPPKYNQSRFMFSYGFLALFSIHFSHLPSLLLTSAEMGNFDYQPVLNTLLFMNCIMLPYGARMVCVEWVHQYFTFPIKTIWHVKNCNLLRGQKSV